MKRHIILTIFTFLSSTAFTQEITNHFTSDFFEKQVFAHRGGYANGPENTIETILYNISQGVSAIEVDIKMTKDNKLVLFHDETIARVLETEGADIHLNDITLNELQKLPLRDKSNGIQYVASLQELVDTLTILIPQNELNHFIIELDFKPHGELGKVAIAELLHIINNTKDTFGNGLYNYFFVSSFYPDVLQELRKQDKIITTAFAVMKNPPSSVFMARIAILLAPRFIRKYKISIIEPDICMINKRFVRKWHKKGILINTYTANSACEKEEIKKYKIAYTTNCPYTSCQPDASDQIKPKSWCKSCIDKK